MSSNNSRRCEDAFMSNLARMVAMGHFSRRCCGGRGKREKSNWGRCSEVLATCEERDRGVKGGVASETETDIDFVLFFSLFKDFASEPSPTQSLDFSFECFSLNQKAPLLIG